MLSEGWKGWLAGLFDGEGSIGIALDHKPERVHRPYMLAVSVQMCMTCQDTIEHALWCMQELGVRGLGYTYQEKDPAKHLDAHHIRVNRLSDVLLLAAALRPYAFTKRPQWELMIEYARSRLDGVEVQVDGVLARGGAPKRKYSEREVAIAMELRRMNLRGPAAIKKRDEWERKAKSLLDPK